MSYPNNPYYTGYYMPYQTGAVPDMLNQYKNPYQQGIPVQMHSQQIPPQSVPVAQPTNDMLWVLGEVEATSYPVAPNNTVVLWDKDQPTVFIKSVNAQGVPSMRILDYVERPSNAPRTPQKANNNGSNDFVHVEQFEALERRLNEMQSEIESLTAKTKTKNTKITEED